MLVGYAVIGRLIRHRYHHHWFASLFHAAKVVGWRRVNDAATTQSANYYTAISHDVVLLMLFTRRQHAGAREDGLREVTNGIMRHTVGDGAL